jgi:hypothetical protein
MEELKVLLIEIVGFNEEKLTIRSNVTKKNRIDVKVNYNDSLNTKQLECLVNIANEKNLNLLLKRSGSGLLIKLKQ